MHEVLVKLSLALLICIGGIVVGYSLRGLEISAKQSNSTSEPALGLPRRIAGSSTPAPAGNPHQRDSDEVVTERNGLTQGLIDGLIRAYDLSSGSGPEPRKHIGRVLEYAGVMPITAVANDQFDPECHAAIERRPDGHIGAAQRIAALHRIGWRDQRGVRRLAEVAVWTNDSAHDMYRER